MSIEIRKALRNDISRVLEWRVKFMLDTYGKEMTYEFKNYTTKHLEKNIDSNNLIVYLAEDNSKIVSSVIIAIYDVMPKLANTTGRVAYMFNVSTLKEYRGQGIATKLLKLTVDEAKKLGAEEIYLSAESEAINLYKSIGFDIVDREMVIRF